MIESGLVILIALAGGIAVGSGYVAFLAVLGIIPRLAQLTRSGKHIQYFEWAVIAGTLTGAWCSLTSLCIAIPDTSKNTCIFRLSSS